MRHYLSKLWTKIYGKNQKVCWAQKFDIKLLLISIQFEIYQIVYDSLNIAVTLFKLQYFMLVPL
jgi:hypothetical protein